ncbi:Chondroitin sulfate synthase 1 [Desmophyllum pertusum]|uniref:Hexosyltransferase n=1 Tax=Desmophyllum pertusum TaxID=174260 RepID=A0A9X0CQY7_9CNID|nr:Chondroitin sulfate synthase 1 [Desmophyllum pertusum]
MFTSKALYSDASLQQPARHAASRIEVNHLIQKITEFINEERARKIRYDSSPRINYGYSRVHPLYGVQHVMQVTVDSKKKTRNIRSSEITSHERRFYFQQPFGNLLYNTELLNDMPHYVHFIVPLEGRLETFLRFMKNFELVCLKTLQRVKLVVAYSSSVSSPREHKAIMKEYQDKYPEADLIWLEIAGDFSRGKALALAADKFDQTALLFLCDVDLIFNSDFIDRCRMNTALGKRVYFPIVFSQFDPELTYTNKTKPDSYFTINTDAGIWTSYGYGPACIYRDDLDAVGGFNTTIRGWGWEDVDLFDKYVKHKEIEVFRAADLGVIHVYNKKTCDLNLPVRQQTMCQGSKSAGLASQKSLVKAMLSIENTGHE